MRVVCVVALVGIMSSVYGSARFTSACTLLADEDLSHIRGGASMTCIVPIPDPNGVDCNECAPHGNGHGKCDEPGVDEFGQYVQGQNPPREHEYFDVPCRLVFYSYSSPHCTDTPIAAGPCQRTFRRFSAPTYPSGVSCP